jgi:hypothetical protein
MDVIIPVDERDRVSLGQLVQHVVKPQAMARVKGIEGYRRKHQKTE